MEVDKNQYSVLWRVNTWLKAKSNSKDMKKEEKKHEIMIIILKISYVNMQYTGLLYMTTLCTNISCKNI